MDDKLKQIQKLLDAAEGNLHSARNLMREVTGAGGAPSINPEEKAKKFSIIEEGKVIEGVYNGESMIGPDGKEYPVPANYASKSKLVEGDVLKLTIAEDGSFIFKQIQPIERRNLIGTLSYAGGNWGVNAEGKTYKVLQASVTYYKGDPGDQVTIIVPKEHDSTWAAVENIIKSSNAESNNIDEPKADGGENQDAGKAREEKVEEEPTIEMPADPAPETGNKSEDETPELGETDKEILENLSSSTTQEPVAEKKIEEPAEETVEETPVQKPDEQGTSEGIKELDI